MSPLLIAWYKSQLDKDEQEYYDRNIAIAEYLASFINPRAVEMLQANRKRSDPGNQEALIKTLKTISGKHLTEEQIRKNLAQDR
jgi:hypothetical protein